MNLGVIFFCKQARKWVMSSLFNFNDNAPGRWVGGLKSHIFGLSMAVETEVFKKKWH